uniref:Uncharacterized protein n=1 Tax=Musca domestica TaxID=7370 RepID=A0A1I8NBZ4_MUSDO
MESFLTEIKQIRIPRPKFEPRVTVSGNGYANMARPPTPPRDYDDVEASNSNAHSRSYQEGGNDYRFSETKK